MRVLAIILATFALACTGQAWGFARHGSASVESVSVSGTPGNQTVSITASFADVKSNTGLDGYLAYCGTDMNTGYSAEVNYKAGESAGTLTYVFTGLPYTSSVDCLFSLFEEGGGGHGVLTSAEVAVG